MWKMDVTSLLQIQVNCTLQARSGKICARHVHVMLWFRILNMRFMATHQKYAICHKWHHIHLRHGTKFYLHTHKQQILFKGRAIGLEDPEFWIKRSANRNSVIEDSLWVWPIMYKFMSLFMGDKACFSRRWLSIAIATST